MTRYAIYDIINTVANGSRRKPLVLANYGGIAQLVIALGSYPGCRWFKPTAATKSTAPVLVSIKDTKAACDVILRTTRHIGAN